MPVFHREELLTLYRFIPTPIELSSDKKDFFILPQPQQEYLAISNDFLNFRTLSSTEMTDKCQNVDNLYFCENSNIFDLRANDNCLVGLFTENSEKIKSLCPFVYQPKKDALTQIAPHSFLLYHASPKDVRIKCKNPTSFSRVPAFAGSKRIDLDRECSAFTDSFKFSATVSFLAPIVNEVIRSHSFNFAYVMNTSAPEVNQMIHDLDLITLESASTFAEVERRHIERVANEKASAGRTIAICVVISILGLCVTLLIFTKCSPCRNGCRGARQQAQMILVPPKAPVAPTGVSQPDH